MSDILQELYGGSYPEEERAVTAFAIRPVDVQSRAGRQSSLEPRIINLESQIQELSNHITNLTDYLNEIEAFTAETSEGKKKGFRGKFLVFRGLRVAISGNPTSMLRFGATTGIRQAVKRYGSKYGLTAGEAAMISILAPIIFSIVQDLFNQWQATQNLKIQRDKEEKERREIMREVYRGLVPE